VPIIARGAETFDVVIIGAGAAGLTAARQLAASAQSVLLLEARDREESLRRSCAAGAIAASRLGAQPSLPTAAEIDDILRR